MELLSQCLSAWESADKATLHAWQLADKFLPGGREKFQDVEVLIGRCRDMLERIQQGLQARDYVRTADIVEHELPALTDQWQEMLVRFQEAFLAQGRGAKGQKGQKSQKP